MTLLFFIINFLLIFDPFLNFPFGVGAILGSFFLFIYACRLGVRRSDISLQFLIGLLFLNIYTFFGVLFGGQDFRFLVTLLKITIVLGLCHISFRVIVRLCLQRRYLDSLWMVVLLQSLYIVLCFYSPDLVPVGSFFRPPEDSHIYAAILREGTGPRLYPASGQLISGLSSIMSLVMLAYVVFYIRYHVKFNLFSVLIFCSILVVGAVSGRTFFVVVFIGISTYLLFVRPSTLLLAWAIIAVLLLGAWFVLNSYFPFLASWLFEPFINLFSGQGFTTRSSSSLLEEHLFIPTFYDILVPDFVFKLEKGWAAGTDSGFLRYLLFGGLPFMFMMFFVVFFPLYRGVPATISIPVLLSVFAVTLKQESFTNVSFSYAVLIFFLFPSRSFRRFGNG